MLKICYPNDLRQLNKDYIADLNITQLEVKLTDFFSQAIYDGIQNKPTVEGLLIMPFNELVKESIRLNSFITAPGEIERIKKIFNYSVNDSAYQSKKQGLISRFFMKNIDKISLSTCYYCNVEYINSFDDIGDYQNGIDFVKRATEYELSCIDQISEAKAAEIFTFPNKQQITNLNELDGIINPRQKNNLSKIVVKTKKNHFTLDHVLNKAAHPFAALSLYNFVPSCYSCNSKFKQANELVIKAADSYLSPSSQTNSIIDNLKFKLFFSDNQDYLNTNIKSVDDFILDFEIFGDNSDYNTYLNIFKIRPRYVFHKREVLKLINKEKKYSDSQINEIAKVTKLSIEQVKKDIFGEELFDGKLEDNPFTKLKRDIAKDIGIKGVKQ